MNKLEKPKALCSGGTALAVALLQASVLLWCLGSAVIYWVKL